jgi:biopolymer transport protein ExbB/TolQ
MNLIIFQPFLASGALQFAFDKATVEGKTTIGALLILSFLSWTVIITKAAQLYRAGKANARFLALYNEAANPLSVPVDLDRLEDSPACQVYLRAAGELKRLLAQGSAVNHENKRISAPAFESVKATLEEAAAIEAAGLERGMVVLSTAVAGGPFLGLLGTVWGVMETFAGIAQANAATLTAMAPGVAGALIATVVGLLVAIPAMFAYNFMVTSIRNLTQELDAFAARYAAHVSLACVERSPGA